MMTRALLVATLLVGAWSVAVEAAPHWEADLCTPATGCPQTAPANQTSVRIERKLGVTGTYGTLAIQLASPWFTFTDVGPYTDGQVVCWRYVAINASGATTGPETCSGAPVQFPGVPGAPTIQWRFVPQ